MLMQGQLTMFRLAWEADIPDPDNMLSPLLHSSSPTNRTFFRNPVMDQLLEQAREKLDYARRIALYREAERMVMGDPPWIAQHYAVSECLFQPYVQGIETGLLGRRTIRLKKIWLTKGPSEGATGQPSS
jgi:oligopeptide transport system substrate-binding protein